jgi:cobalt-zinc-cadmium efflux system membrane fusion protein
MTACRREPERPAPANAVPADAPGRVVLPANSPKLQQIRVEAVSTADVPMDEVVAPGKVEVNPNRVSHVVLPVPGRIADVKVHLGDSVKQGQELLAVESPEADAAQSVYLQAQAAQTQAKSALLKAQADLERERDLFAHNAVAKKEVLNAENLLIQATAAQEQAQAALTQALRRLQILGLEPGRFGQPVLVRAPIAGRVLEMSVVPGEYRNDITASVMTIADLSTVWISSDVPESAIRKISMGERLNAELSAYPGEVFRARVTRIADMVDPQTRTIKVQAEIQNPAGRLRPEMYGRIRHVEDVRRLPVVPAGAVIQGDGQSIVFVEIAPGVFEQRRVSVGDKAGDRLPVLSGLKPGERVVVDGAMLLKGLLS